MRLAGRVTPHILISGIVYAAAGMWLSGCGTSGSAPVVDISSGYSTPRYVSAVTASGSLPDYHIVNKGETLYSIAWSYGVDHAALAKHNNIDQSFTIYPGQKIYLAKQSAKFEGDTFDEAALKSSVAEALNLSMPKKPSASRSPQHTSKPLTSINSKQRSQRSAKISTKNARQAPRRSGKDSNKRFESWLWPVNGPILERFSNVHGGNKGLDISASEGQAVRAAAPGRVVYRGNALKGYGNLIIVKHNDDYLSAYAHNSKIHVQENEIVKAGQVIADIGSSGTDKSKLHFEIRYRGKPVDPIRYLPPL